MSRGGHLVHRSSTKSRLCVFLKLSRPDPALPKRDLCYWIDRQHIHGLAVHVRLVYRMQNPTRSALLRFKEISSPSKRISVSLRNDSKQAAECCFVTRLPTELSNHICACSHSIPLLATDEAVDTLARSPWPSRNRYHHHPSRLARHCPASTHLPPQSPKSLFQLPSPTSH